MSTRPNKSLLKIKTSDGEEFDIEDEVIKQMETLKTMTMLDDGENVPTCAVNSSSLRRLFYGQSFRTNLETWRFKKDLKQSYQQIILQMKVC